MAEQQKGTSSTPHSKERTSLLDEEIGNEFLTPWKSTTAGDDALDFSCETVPDGRKKPFDFDKLDMDFALDGGFDKISSFKIDMSDLDFSSPPKTTEKQKEISGKEPVLGRQEGKPDQFIFNFDFNALDGFDLDSSLLNEEKNSDKRTGDKGLNSSVKPKRNQDSMSNSATIVDTFVNSDTKKLPPDDATTSKYVLPKDIDTVTNRAPSISRNLGDQEYLLDVSSREKKITTFVQENRTGCHTTSKHTEQSETPRSSEPCVLYPMQAIVQPISGDDSVFGTRPRLQTGHSSSGKEVHTSSSSEPENSLKSVDSLHSRDSSATSSFNLQCSPAKCIMESKETDTKFDKISAGHIYVAKESAIGWDSVRSNKGFGGVAMTSVSKISHDMTVATENPYSVSKAVLQLHRESTIGRTTPLKEKATGVIYSKYFSKSEDTQSQLLSASTPRKISLCNKKLEGMHIGPTNAKSPKFGGSEKQTGDQKVGVSDLDGRTFTKAHAILGSEKNDKELVTSREFTADEPLPSKGKGSGDIYSKYSSKPEGSESLLHSGSAPRKVPLCNKKLEGVHLDPPNTKSTQFEGCEKQVGNRTVGISESNCSPLTKGPVIQGSEKNNKEVNSSGFQVHLVNLPEQSITSGISRSSNSKLAVPSMDLIRSSKIVSVEKHKTTPPRSNTKSFDFSGLNITSSMASKSESSNITFQKEIKSIKQPEKNIGMLLNTASKLAPSVNTEKCALIYSSLKRKSPEGPCFEPMSLNPLKRAVESHTESRDVEEASLRIEGKMIVDIDNPEDCYKSDPFNHSASSPDIPLEANMTDLEGPMLMESDENVEKAEACAKELEAICNMLKKKQDEAKEVLVRAIVNNNLLLMLNHPSYEERIETIQRNVASILSKKQQT